MSPERALTEQSREDVQSDEFDEGDGEPPGAGDIAAAFAAPSNTWLLFGIFTLLAVGVLVLLIFASGGDSNSSML
jgi:hypothetical protein